MKIRQSFISNSSSSSFVIGYTGEEKITKYSDMYNLNILLEIKKNCIKMNMSVPKEILDLEKKANKSLVDISINDIMSVEKKEIRIDKAIVHKYEDDVMIDVTKLPEGVKYIQVKFKSE